MNLSGSMKAKIAELKKDGFDECDTAANRTIVIRLNQQTNTPEYKTISRSGVTRDGCHP